MTWAPPELADPETIHLDNQPTTERSLKLDDGRSPRRRTALGGGGRAMCGAT